MTSFDSWSFKFFSMTLATLAIIVSKSLVTVALPIEFQPSPWSLAHATFYGDETASETLGMFVI